MQRGNVYPRHYTMGLYFSIRIQVVEGDQRHMWGSLRSFLTNAKLFDTYLQTIWTQFIFIFIFLIKAWSLKFMCWTLQQGLLLVWSKFLHELVYLLFCFWSKFGLLDSYIGPSGKLWPVLVWSKFLHELVYVLFFNHSSVPQTHVLDPKAGRG